MRDLSAGLGLGPPPLTDICLECAASHDMWRVQRRTVEVSTKTMYALLTFRVSRFVRLKTKYPSVKSHQLSPNML
jgi:hypothetical protein